MRKFKGFQLLRGESRRAQQRPISARGGAGAAVQCEVLPLGTDLSRRARRLSHCPDGSVRSWLDNEVVLNRPNARGVVCNLSCLESRLRRQTLPPQRRPPMGRTTNAGPHLLARWGFGPVLSASSTAHKSEERWGTVPQRRCPATRTKASERAYVTPSQALRAG